MAGWARVVHRRRVAGGAERSKGGKQGGTMKHMNHLNGSG